MIENLVKMKFHFMNLIFSLNNNIKKHEYTRKDKEVDRIYLNFSDPWPKERHAKRRLTSPVFLEKYDAIFRKNANIIMKTDNNPLFEYSLETLAQHGYEMISVTRDLYKEDLTDNIATEYEKRFINKGISINKFIAIKK